MLGETLIVLSQLAVAAGMITAKKLVGKMDPLVAAFAFTAVGAIALAPVLLFRPVTIPGEAVGLIVVAGVLMQAVWAVLNFYGLSLISASNAAAFALSYQVFAIGLAIAFLGEQLTLKFVAGAAIMAIGALVILL